MHVHHKGKSHTSIPQGGESESSVALLALTGGQYVRLPTLVGPCSGMSIHIWEPVLRRGLMVLAEILAVGPELPALLKPLQISVAAMIKAQLPADLIVQVQMRSHLCPGYSYR